MSIKSPFYMLAMALSVGLLVGISSPAQAQPIEEAEDGPIGDADTAQQIVELDDMLRSDTGAERSGPVGSVFPYDEPQEHWMWVIGRNAVWGGMLGGLIGVGVYLVTGMEPSPWIISQFAGGGILVGAASGVIEAAFWSTGFVSKRSESVRWISRDTPRIYDIRLLDVEF